MSIARLHSGLRGTRRYPSARFGKRADITDHFADMEKRKDLRATLKAEIKREFDQATARATR